MLPAFVRFTVAYVGALLAMAGSYFLVAKSTEALDPFSAPLDGSNGSEPTVVAIGLWLAAAVVAAILGSAMFALFLTSRLRVSVVIRDKAGKANDAAVDKAVAYMTELGASRPRGLQVPRATDVTVLSGDVLVDAPTNKILAALKKIVQSALLFVPWNVAIDETGDDEMSVVVARNGWVSSAVAFSTKSLGLGESDSVSSKRDDAGPAVSPPMDRLHKVAAAVVISTLATRHRGFEGLCGASDWRSIGLHFIATTELDQEPDRAAAVLAHALNADPFNLPAQLASQYYKYRKSVSARDLLEFTKWLEDRIVDFPRTNTRVRREHEGIYCRMLLNYVLAMLNLNSLQPLNDDQLSRAAHHADLLTERLSQRVPAHDLMRLTMRQVAAVAYQAISELQRTRGSTVGAIGAPNQDWFEAAKHSLAPSVAYNMACYHAVRSPLTTAGKVEQPLSVACQDERLRSWAKEDPVLTKFHQEEWFRELVGASPRRSFLEIEPFKEHQKKFEAIGASTPSKLAAVAPWRLKEHLDVSSLQLDRMLRVARLAQKVARPVSFLDIEKYYVEVLDLLVSDGVEDVKDIQNDEQQRRALAKKLEQRCLVTLPDDKLSRWLDTLKA